MVLISWCTGSETASLSAFPGPRPMLFMKGRSQTSHRLQSLTPFSHELKFFVAEPVTEETQKFRWSCYPVGASQVFLDS